MTNDKNISIKQMPKSNTIYSNEIMTQLFELGCFRGMDGNFENERELNKSEIIKFADLCSLKDGILKRYDQWFCKSANIWRLILAYEA